MTNKNRGRTGKAKRRQGTSQLVTPKRDELSSWTTCRLNMPQAAGQKGAWAVEVPFTITNLTTTADIGDWTVCKRYRLHNVKVTVNLPGGFDGQVFIGWNRTPYTGTITSVETVKSYHLYMDRTDRRVTSRQNNEVSVSLSIRSTGWKQYFSAALYQKYRDLLDREVKEFCHGSLVFGYNSSKTHDVKDFIDGIRIDCVQTLLLSKGA